MVVKGYSFQKGFDCMKKFYLAYGSNLNVKQMQFRCPDARIVGTAEIPNYQLLFKGSKTGSYLTIEPKQGCTVPAAVWSVSERDELALDRYEGYPHFYYKTELELPLAETGKKLTAFVISVLSFQSVLFAIALAFAIPYATIVFSSVFFGCFPFR